jgi:hypothetical protein
MIGRLAMLLLAAGLGACSREPLSPDYFIAHPKEAARHVADCKRGSLRGQECVNATAGVAAAEGAEPM